MKRLLAWVKQHPLKTLFLVLCAYLLFELLTIPFFSIARLTTENPKETALMRQRIAEARDEGEKLAITHRWIPLSRLPRHVVNAVIVAEDGTFYSHGGIDWFEVRESIKKNIDTRRAARGASTITQQLAKNLYLSTSKTPLRKLKEMIITFLLEEHLSKNRILEIYLNSIEWGRGVFGIEAAARTFFGKSASELTLDEATRLAAVIPSPLRHRPDSDSRYVMRRKNIVLKRMQARRFTTTEEATPQPDTNQMEKGEEEPEILTPEDSLDLNEDEQNELQGRQPVD